MATTFTLKRKLFAAPGGLGSAALNTGFGVLGAVDVASTSKAMKQAGADHVQTLKQMKDNSSQVVNKLNSIAKS